MTSTSPTPNIRLTISVTPEVHETFQRIAKAGNMSISKAMGEWLGDSIEAAQFMAEKMEQARSAPKLVMAEMHAYAMGMADETGALIEKMRQAGLADRARGVMPAQRVVRSAREPSPPSSNTGGKVTRTNSIPKR